jgi:hypothetical protein
MKYIGCRKIDSTNIKCAKEKNLIKRPILGWKRPSFSGPFHTLIAHRPFPSRHAVSLPLASSSFNPQNPQPRIQNLDSANETSPAPSPPPPPVRACVCPPPPLLPEPPVPFPSRAARLPDPLPSPLPSAGRKPDALRLPTYPSGTQQSRYSPSQLDISFELHHDRWLAVLFICRILILVMLIFKPRFCPLCCRDNKFHMRRWSRRAPSAATRSSRSSWNGNGRFSCCGVLRLEQPLFFSTTTWCLCTLLMLSWTLLP